MRYRTREALDLLLPGDGMEDLKPDIATNSVNRKTGEKRKAVLEFEEDDGEGDDEPDVVVVTKRVKREEPEVVDLTHL